MPNQRILVCDDEESIRETLKLVLDDSGYETTLTSNGTECLDTLNKGDRFDLIVLDVKMPQESGIDTLVKIKEKYPDTRIIVLTGYRSVEVAHEAVKRGALDYMVKPFEPKELLQKIKVLLGV